MIPPPIGDAGNETVNSLRRLSLEPGRDYSVVVVSIDPSETPALAAEKKESYRQAFNLPSFNAGWHFLTGSQPAITQLAQAVGFHYRWDEKTKQFIHAAAIMVATPEGKLSRYFYGVQYAPADLRMALVIVVRDEGAVTLGAGQPEMIVEIADALRAALDPGRHRSRQDET